MIFLYENILYFLVIVPIFGWWLWRYYSKRKASQKKFAENPLLSIISPVERRWVPYLRILIILLALTCLILAAARPKGGEIEVEAKTEGIDIFLVVDLSKSMAVEDVGMSRMKLQKAIAKAIMFKE